MKRINSFLLVVLVVAALSGAPLSSVVAQTTNIPSSTGTGQMGTTPTKQTGVAGAVQGASSSSLSSLGSGQSAGQGGFALPDADARAQIAMSTADYPVTPGDVYGLSYIWLTQVQTLKVVVEGDGTVNLGIFGKFKTSGLTFRSFKSTIESKVEAAYPQSSPTLLVVSTGLFPIKVQGQVQHSSLVTAWGLTRLSEVVQGNMLADSSIRDIQVTASGGKANVYDLFKAGREGDLSQDPYVRPGDVVTVSKAARIVTLEGEVRRPGTYQLKEGEGVGELVGYYGDGALESAKTDLVVVTRKASAEKPESESVVFDVKGKALPGLYDGDRVRVPSREEYLPVVYIEGAVGGAEVGVKQEAQAGNAQGVVTQQYGVTRVAYRQGILLSQVVKGIKGQLDARADLKRAFITRKGERNPIEVNLEVLLYAYDAKDDIVLQAEDHVVIPYGSMYVFVTGAVTKSAWVGITGLTRLSEVVKPLETGYSSERDVKVRSEDGAEAVYDLFKAGREGDLSQDPYVRPGDVVTVSKAARIVTLEGEVRRPGTYQLREGEGVGELIGYYGDGALESAKTDLVVVTRKASAEKPESESVVFDVKGKALPGLYDGDRVRVPSREEYLPVVYIEGAVGGDLLAASNKDQTVQQTNYALIRALYRSGLTVSSLLRPMRDKILSSGDLKQAFIIHKGEAGQTEIDLEKLLYGNDLSNDVALYPEDRIIIPFGSMYVFVTGEVSKSSWVAITGLTRLRDVVTPLLTRYSSIRDVKVLSSQGNESTYDLFKAERFGDLTQDPFLMPGDTVKVSSDVTLVTIQGEVKRPGTYQLLMGEGLKELVEYYAEGFTEKANSSRLSLVRYTNAKDPVGEKQQLDYATNKNMMVSNYDVFSVPPMQDLLPVLWFEGAVGVGSTGPTPETSQRQPYTFYPGETISEAAIANRKLFSAVSDLSNAYLIRKGKRINVDLSKFIYDYSLEGDVKLEPNDTIIVPFRQFFVTVSGAVHTPGRYPYIPNRSWEYYVGLAGGFDTDRNSGQKITIYDVNSQKVASSGRVIQPEDNIEAASNSWLYNFTKVSGVVSTIVTTILVIFEAINLLGM